MIECDLARTPLTANALAKARDASGNLQKMVLRKRRCVAIFWALGITGLGLVVVLWKAWSLGGDAVALATVAAAVAAEAIVIAVGVDTFAASRAYVLRERQIDKTDNRARLGYQPAPEKRASSGRLHSQGEEHVTSHC